MQRNWEIIRDVLLQLEAETTPNSQLNARDFDAYPMQEVAYNMRLLHDAECIDAKFLNSSTGSGEISSAVALRLTSTGHDLLDVIKSDPVWEKTKDAFQAKGVEMTIDLVIKIGKQIMESLFT